MSDLISREQAIDAVEKESQIDGAYGYMDTKSIVDLLNDLPSAQPEIIRCKDCKHWKVSQNNTCGIQICYLFGGVREEYDFCSRGEKA